MIGDSTMANKPYDNEKPERGWGMALQGFFTDDIVVDNHAVNGRSSKSFIDEGRWQVVCDKITPGDYVIIQFGHNDEKPKEDRHTDPGSTFDANLTKFITATRERGGIPILMNAVVRRNFEIKAEANDDDEKLRDTVFTGKEGRGRQCPCRYSRRLHHSSAQCGWLPPRLFSWMPIKSLTTLSRGWVQRSRNSFTCGSNPVRIRRFPKVVRTIPTTTFMAPMWWQACWWTRLAKVVPSLKKYVRHYDYIVAADGKGNYMDLQQAVDDVPMGKKTVVRILNGEWQYPSIPKGKKIKFSVSEHAKLKKR